MILAGDGVLQAVPRPSPMPSIRKMVFTPEPAMVIFSSPTRSPAWSGRAVPTAGLPADREDLRQHLDLLIGGRGSATNTHLPLPSRGSPSAISRGLPPDAIQHHVAAHAGGDVHADERRHEPSSNWENRQIAAAAEVAVAELITGATHLPMRASYPCRPVSSAAGSRVSAQCNPPAC